MSEDPFKQVDGHRPPADLFTTIVIRHTTVEALKASPIWREIMAIAFTDGDVEVVEIAKSEDDDR